MSFVDLVGVWDQQASGELVHEQYRIDLTVENAAKVEALAELFPLRSREQLIAELLGTALDELVASFPYRQGDRIIARDEEGDPIFEDVGYTPRYLALVQKHVHKLRGQS
ncbi:type 1 pili tip component [Haliea sp. E17]|uniref:type 1 pili tip component n=1 Tax=Haliea sp. E17 TaxID=3401576 RepID=UPI003AAE1B23